MRVEQQPECVTLVAENPIDENLLRAISWSILEANKGAPRPVIMAPVRFRKDTEFGSAHGELDVWKF